jgi:hypothetical protein
MPTQHYKGYCLTYKHNKWQIEGFTNTFYSIETATAFIDILTNGITKANENCKPTVCPKCQNKGWYYVNEFIGNLQGRRDCNCIYKN